MFVTQGWTAPRGLLPEPWLSAFQGRLGHCRRPTFLLMSPKTADKSRWMRLLRGSALFPAHSLSLRTQRKLPTGISTRSPPSALDPPHLGATWGPRAQPVLGPGWPPKVLALPAWQEQHLTDPSAPSQVFLSQDPCDGPALPQDPHWLPAPRPNPQQCSSLALRHPAYPEVQGQCLA